VANPYPAAFIDQNNEGRLVGELNFTDAGNQPGGSSPSTATATVTTDPNTFTVTHVFDCGHPTTVYWKATIVAQTADGETFGMGAGEIHGDQNVNEISRDDVTYIALTVPAYFHDSPTGSIGDVTDRVQATARYFKLGVAVFDDNFSVYSGPNHPTVTFRLDIEYL